MNQSEQIRLSLRIAEKLNSLENWATVDFILNRFGFPTSGTWGGSIHDYVLWSLSEKRPEDDLQGLADYVLATQDEVSLPDDAIGVWEKGAFRLFVTHVSSFKAFANELKTELRNYAVDAFVAHEDIEPLAEWQTHIESALRTCDGLSVLLHDGVTISKWCDQEVGFALGRGLTPIPIRIGLDPYGLIGKFQAIPGTAKTPAQIAYLVFEVIANNPSTAPILTRALVNRLVDSTSFQISNDTSKNLKLLEKHISDDDIARLISAKNSNIQVRDAWYAARQIDEWAQELKKGED